MENEVFRYLLFKPLDPKQLSLLKELTTLGKALGAFGAALW